jgi:hypothetical protein
MRKETMIMLDDTLLIGRGQVRSCYRHPQNELLIVKVPGGIQKAHLRANHKEMKGVPIFTAQARQA